MKFAQRWKKIGLPGACLVALAVLLIGTNAPATTGYPEVRFDYSFVPFDRVCSQRLDIEIEQAWIEELEDRMDEFRAVWAERGPRLLAATVEETGIPFRRKEVQAAMTLCTFPSMSLPLLLNMRRYLSSTTDGQPRPAHLFAALVFHELLHMYVYDIRPESALLEKYAEEPFSVQTHVHLMALVKHAYLTLGYKDDLADVMALDRRIGPIYARSWEIVEQEGYEAFMAELKQAARAD